MKVFFLLMIVSFNIMASEKCFNVEEYGQICLNYEGSPINNSIQVRIYKGTKLQETLTTTSSEYHPGGSFCGGKEHDCWTIPGGFQVVATSAKYSVFMTLSRWMTINNCVRCSGGSMTVKGDRDLYFRIE